MGAGGGPKTKVRVAFTGEEYGFGYQAVGKLLDRAGESPKIGLSDGGTDAVHAGRPQEIQNRPNRAMRSYDFTHDAAQRQPLRTKEQALMAVKQHTADYALVPFYAPYTGYDYESLRAVASQLALFGCEQVEATDNLCLAVYEPQVLEIVQAAHPGSALSSLMRHDRRGWGSHESARPTTRHLDLKGAGDQYRAGLQIDQSQQLLLRDRIDTVFCGTEAARRCKSKLDGLRGAGVDIKETLNTVEPHREMARLARQTLNTSRQTTSFYDPRSGQTSFASTMGAEAQSQRLYAVILPFQVAMMSPEYTIIDPYMEDGDQPKTRFMAVEYNPDLTLFEDAYRTTDAKTRYWMRRLVNVASLAKHRYTKSHHKPHGEAHGGHDDHHHHDPKSFPGVRVMLAFQRAGGAAAIGDVENFLRNFGVRHAVARLDEDSEANAPANVMLDIEFAYEDFFYNPARRLRGSIANGAMKKAFQRWKSRGVLVLAGMPFETAQLPPHSRRHWLFDAPAAWAADFAETMFIRMARVLLVYALPASIVLFLLAAGLKMVGIDVFAMMGINTVKP